MKEVVILVVVPTAGLVLSLVVVLTIDGGSSHASNNFSASCGSRGGRHREIDLKSFICLDIIVECFGIFCTILQYFML